MGQDLHEAPRLRPEGQPVVRLQQPQRMLPVHQPTLSTEVYHYRETAREHPQELHLRVARRARF